MSPSRFRRHISWLANNGYRGICPSDWLSFRRGERKGLPSKPVLITFDDAYADLVEHALPVLHQHSFGGAVFVVTGLVGGTNIWAQRKYKPGSYQLMSAAHICEWAARGIEFGAHGRTHTSLTSLQGTALRREVEGSALELAGILGRRVVSFAYPYGDFNDGVFQLVRDNFEMAFTTQWGINRPATDLHRLRRAPVRSNDSLGALSCRLFLGWHPAEQLRRRAGEAARRLGFSRSVECGVRNAE